MTIVCNGSAGTLIVRDGDVIKTETGQKGRGMDPELAEGFFCQMTVLRLFRHFQPMAENFTSVFIQYARLRQRQGEV